MRKKIWGALALAIVTGAAHAGQSAANYPDKPIHLVIPYTPGGSADVLGRAIALQLSKAFGQPVIVDNRSGAGGLIGAQIVASSTADGYTLLYGPNALYSILPLMYPKASVNVRRDLEPVAMVSFAPMVMAVSSKLPIKTLPELIAYVQARPGRVTFGSAGNASLQHMIGENFDLLAGVKMIHVPYKGTSQASTDLGGGRLDVLYGSLTSIEPLVQAGKARLIAVSSSRRFSGLPDLPSIGETVKGWPDMSTFQGVFAPKGTPSAVIDKLSHGIAKATQSPDFQRDLKANAFDANPGDSAQFKMRLEADYASLSAIIKAANIHAED